MHWKLFLNGPPNRYHIYSLLYIAFGSCWHACCYCRIPSPNEDVYGLIEITTEFMDSLSASRLANNGINAAAFAMGMINYYAYISLPFQLPQCFIFRRRIPCTDDAPPFLARYILLGDDITHLSAKILLIIYSIEFCCWRCRFFVLERRCWWFDVVITSLRNIPCLSILLWIV